MSEAISVEEVDFHQRLSEIRAVRFAVFVEEQGVPAAIEMDDWDALSRHALALRDGVAIGTGRLLPDGHIGRVAVLRAARGQGVGARILERLMEMGRSRGMSRFELSAQTQALAFYQKLGFFAVGEVYREAGIEHVKMILEPPPQRDA